MGKGALNPETQAEWALGIALTRSSDGLISWMSHYQDLVLFEAVEGYLTLVEG